MVTPNMPSSAQDIINNFLSGGYSTAAQANPYRVDVDPFRPPVDTPDDTPETDPCPEGYVYDPVMKRCMPIEEQQESGGGDDDSPFDPTKALLDRMKKDPTTGFGASSILDDYITQGFGEGTFLKFDPSIGRLGANAINPLINLGGGLLDNIIGGADRRKNLYNDAIKFFTDNQYGESLGSELFKIYNPQQYYNTVSTNLLDPENKMQETSNLTVGNAVEQMVKSSQPSQGGGSPIAEDLTGGLLYTTPLTSVDSAGNRSRNDAAYRASLARNVRDNPFKFRSNVGGTGRAGFIGGR